MICLDVNMPGGSGLSACEMISQDEDLAGIPVIILTGCYDEETIRRCHKMSAYYVLKVSRHLGANGATCSRVAGFGSVESGAEE